MMPSARVLFFLQLALLCCFFQESDARSSGANSTARYQNTTFTVCADSAVMIEDLSVLCDSPGTYYYGSSKYRNAAQCQAGDKAKVSIIIDVEQDLQTEPYFTLLVKGYGSVESVDVYTAKPMCSVSGIKALDGQKCPGKGRYKIYESFFWGEKSDNYDYAFTPKATVGFSSGNYKQAYDLGGANTNLCSGKTFQSWTESVRKSAANTVETFFVTFGFLLGSVMAICFAGWCIVRQAHNETKELMADDPIDETDYHKFSMIGDDRNNLAELV